MSILYQFGTYAYPKSTILSAPKPGMAAKTRFADTPGQPGRYTQGGLPGARQIKIKGQLIPASGDDLDALVSALYAAHAPGQPQPLYVGRDDRYYLAECVGFRDTDDDGRYPTSKPWEASFEADAYEYAASTTTTGTGTTGATVTTTGSAGGVPVISLTLTGTAAGTVTITNTTTGNAMQLVTPIAGNAPLIYCAAHQVVNSVDSSDLTHLFSGIFFELAPGANVITIAAAPATIGGTVPNLTASSFTWRDRWY